MSARAGGFGAREGAVYVEFLIAFLPVFTFFCCLLQLMLIYTADIVMRHAAWSAVRAAIVTFPDDPKVTAHPMADITSAAKYVCQAVPMIAQNSVVVSANDVGHAKAPVTATVSARYVCPIMLANVIMCPEGFLNLRATATMPNQGADYDY